LRNTGLDNGRIASSTKYYYALVSVIMSGTDLHVTRTYCGIESRTLSECAEPLISFN